VTSSAETAMVTSLEYRLSWDGQFMYP